MLCIIGYNVGVNISDNERFINQYVKTWGPELDARIAGLPCAELVVELSKNGHNLTIIFVRVANNQQSKRKSMDINAPGFFW